MTPDRAAPKLRVHNFTVSLDGYAAGPDQDLEHPLGVRGGELHEWAFATPSFLDGGPVGYECAEFVASPAALRARCVKAA